MSSNTDFWIKLRLEGKEGRPLHKFHLEDLSDISYEVLARIAVALTFSDAGFPIPMSTYNVTMKYQDPDEDWVTIASDRALVYAIADFADQGYIEISANVAKSETHSVVPPMVASSVELLPPTHTKEDVDVNDDTQKRKPVYPVNDSRIVADQLEAKTSVPKDEARALVRSAPVAVPVKLEAGPMSPSWNNEKKVSPSRVASATVQHKESGSKGLRRKICSSLLELFALGIKVPPRIHVALLSGYTNLASKSIARAFADLRNEGVIEYPNPKTMRLSPKAISLFDPVALPKDNEEMQMRLRNLLKTMKGHLSAKVDILFEFLCDGGIHMRKDLAREMGYTNIASKGFTQVISMMKSLELIYYPANSQQVQLTDIAFPYGRP